jgi:ABC-2 type transport system permease protein
LRRDPVLVFLIFYTFTFAIYSVATGVRTEVRNASIAIVDEDHSELSRRIHAAFLRPYFKPAVELSLNQVDEAMDAGRFAFVVDIPPKFEADVLAGHDPALQLNVDATAMTLAGNGTIYIQNIINQEVTKFVFRGGSGTGTALPASVIIRAKFNPNLESSWFMAVMQIISNVTMLSLILSGAAVIREREHGTIEHLLVMPLTPGEIMLAKIWANGLVIVLAAIISLYAIVQGVLAVRINGSVALRWHRRLLFAMTALGITLSTVAKSCRSLGC